MLRNYHQRYYFLFGFLFLLTFLFSCQAPTDILQFEATVLPSGYLFINEPPDSLLLRKFRQNNDLDKVIRGTQTELEMVQALADWSASQFPETSPFPNYPPWNAEEILNRIRTGQTGGFCAQYAIIFGQALQSFGYSVRYVDLASKSGSSHFVTSVFLPHHKKWVMVDPTHAEYYLDKNKIPLGELEIHKVASGALPGPIYSSKTKKIISTSKLSFFENIRFYLRNNFLSIPVYISEKKHPNGIQLLFEPYRLRWIDEFTKNQKEANPSFTTQNADDFNFSPLRPSSSKAIFHENNLRTLLSQRGTILVKMPRKEFTKFLESYWDPNLYHPLEN